MPPQQVYQACTLSDLLFFSALYQLLVEMSPCSPDLSTIVSKKKKKNSSVKTISSVKKWRITVRFRSQLDACMYRPPPKTLFTTEFVLAALKAELPKCSTSCERSDSWCLKRLRPTLRTCLSHAHIDFTCRQTAGGHVKTVDSCAVLVLYRLRFGWFVFDVNFNFLQSVAHKDTQV